MERGNARNRMLDFWLGVPLLNLLAPFRRKHILPAQPRTIGVMCSPALGDTLLFSAVFRDLRSHFTASRIVFFYMRQNQAAAELITGPDRRILLSLTNPLQSIRTLRAHNLDLLLDFTAWQRLTALLTLLSGTRFSVGFLSAGQHRGRGYDLAVPHRRNQHELENFRDLLRAIAVPVGYEPTLTIPPLDRQPFPQESDLILLHLWASGNRGHLREWPEDRWIEAAQRIRGRDTLFVVTGAPSDLPRMDDFVTQMRSAGLRAVAFPGSDGFISLAHLLRRARLLISVNTGVMHLAAVLGTPTLSLDGPTAATRWGPRGPRGRSVAPEDRSGGFLHLGFEYHGQPEDIMRRISVDQVVDAAQRLLAEHPSSSSETREVLINAVHEAN